MLRLDNKIALITGGGGAIGTATARAFVREGATVVITEVNAAAAAAAAEDGIAFLQHDVTRDEDWTRVVAEIVGQHGRLDILINNAGILGTVAQNPENVTLEEWRRVAAVNVDGVVLGCKHAIAAMREHGGAIVNLSSVAGLRGMPFLYPYGGSKGAVRQLTKSVASYCGRLGYKIRCNSVHPSLIESRMGHQVVHWVPGKPDDVRRQLIEAVPLKRLGTPNDVADAILYLASDGSSYVTGEELVVDGGFTI